MRTSVPAVTQEQSQAQAQAQLQLQLVRQLKPAGLYPVQLLQLQLL
jgi:hypothetical protein